MGWRRGCKGVNWESGDIGKEGRGGKQELEKESLREIKAVVDYCGVKFGEEEIRNATGAWVKPGEDHRKTGEEMVTGGKGYR